MPIYFKKCRKSRFTKKQASFSKIIELKVLDKLFCEGFSNSAAHTS